MIERRDRLKRHLIGLAAVLVTLGLLAFVVAFVLSAMKSKPRPFDLRTVGVACHDDPAWICGFLQVPLNRDSPAAGSIDVHFRLLPRRQTAQRSAGTIVLVAGGPGESAMSQYVWAEGVFRSLEADHDLLLVDDRGSGLSAAIDCPLLQDDDPFEPTDAVTQCRELLGARANDYSTVAAADDLDAVLSKIQAVRVDLYAESYGTFFAQVFAMRHPHWLQRIALDGAYPISADAWNVYALPTALSGLRAVCRTSVHCQSYPDPTTLISKVLAIDRRDSQTEPSPLSSASGLVRVLADAGRDGSAYRELLAALRSRLAGDPLPLLRLVEEASPPPQDAPPSLARSFSDGLLLADTCADRVQPFDLRSPLPTQQRQLANARKEILKSSTKMLAPFAAEQAVPSGAQCLGWPAPPDQVLPSVAGRTFPNSPTLVLEGSLDTVTPPAGARSVAKEFRDGRYVEVPFGGHVTARWDNTGCVASVVAAFFASGTINTRCFSRLMRPTQVESFPPRFIDETPAIPTTSTGLPPNDARVLAVVRDVVSDILWRTRLGSVLGPGLRGGSFSVKQLSQGGRSAVRLKAIRWTTDTAVTGSLSVSPTEDSMSGEVDVSTPIGSAHFDIHARLFGSPNSESIFGEIAGRKVGVLLDGNFGL